MCGSSPNSPTSAGSWTLPIWALADATEVEILNLLDDHSRLCVASQARRVFKAGDVDELLRHRRHPLRESRHHAQRQRRGVHRPLPRPGPRGPGDHPGPPRDPVPPLPALPPPDLRQGETVPPDPQAAGSPPGLGPGPCDSSKPSSTASAATTTPSGHTAPLAGAPRSRPTRPGPKAVPTGQPLADTHYRIRHDKIDPSGVFTLRHNSRLHHIGVGRRHAGTDMLVLVQDRHVPVLTHDGQLMRDLQLDPSKDYQPQRQT